MSDEKRRIEVYDTTLRDGTQALGVSLSLHEKLQIAAALDRLGVDFIEGGYPLSNIKDAEFFREARRLELRNAKLAAFGMTRRRGTAADNDEGLRALLDSEAQVVTVVGKSWPLHVREVLRADDAENLAMVAESVGFLAARGRQVFFDAEHFFDGWADDSDYALAVLRAARDAGAALLVLCDTNGGSQPQRIAEVVAAVREAMGGAAVGIHCHNDCGLAVAGTLAAVRAGAGHVQGTINGIGERCGNADLTAVIGNLAVKLGHQCLRPGTLAHLTEVSRFVYEAANLNFQENQPFVGAAAFAHKGGMHVHAVRRNARTYEHMDPAVVGNARRVLVSELSGASNIAAAAAAHFAIAEDKAVQRKVLAEVVRLENAGYQFEAAEASFEMLIRRTLGGNWHRPLWTLDHYRSVIFKRDEADSDTEAIVKLTVGGRQKHTVADGDGPVDSLYKALREAIRHEYPCVDELHLVDYRVRVVNTAAETAAKVRVVIDWHDASTAGHFGSVGVSVNIIEASWQAITDAIEYTVLRSLEGGPAAGSGQQGHRASGEDGPRPGRLADTILFEGDIVSPVEGEE